MKNIAVNQAEKTDIEWINKQYSEIDFVKSNYNNEFIVIAKVENENAGLGRLVKIDDHNTEMGGIYVLPLFRSLGVAEKIVSQLCEKNPFETSTIWCLPFDHLLNFYSKFGFTKYENGNIPDEIVKKHNWCNTGNNYEHSVSLLYKKNKSI